MENLTKSGLYQRTQDIQSTLRSVSYRSVLLKPAIWKTRPQTLLHDSSYDVSLEILIENFGHEALQPPNAILGAAQCF